MSEETWSAPTNEGWNQPESPYVNWWLEKENGARNIGGDDPEFVVAHVPAPRVKAKDGKPVKLRMPLPIPSHNPALLDPDTDFHWPWRKADMVDALSTQRIGQIDRKTVIVAVIDVGIPLCHRRLRLENGRTRFIASWQQTSKFAGQSYLPFGQELYADRINELLELASDNNDLRSPALNEEMFNRRAHLVEPQYLFGHRDLDYSGSHGAHVTDLAAGVDAAAAPDAASDVRLIAVNLPPQYVHGSAGNFLSQFAGFAVERILRLADFLWDIQIGEIGGGFPVAINFSFGKQAGPKDGNSEWERAFSEMVRERNARGVPTRVLMPVGNRNTGRGNASATLQKSTSSSVASNTEALKTNWHVPPGDHTSNFVEVWSKPRPYSSDQQEQDVPPSAFQLFVTPPGHTDELPVQNLTPGNYSDLGEYARVYCYQAPNQKRASFVVCATPTLNMPGTVPEAPAGLWQIRVRYQRARPQEVTFCVQTDQSGVRHATTGEQSYFYDKWYQTHLESGRWRDSFKLMADQEPRQDQGPVQRKGTHNAIATWPEVMVIGSYRASDDKPTLFSATFDPETSEMGGRTAPTVLLPGDDSPSHFGLLASGSKEGSVAAFRGTSMSTALATRLIAGELRRSSQASSGSDPATEDWLKAQVKPDVPETNELKAGAGNVAMPDTGRLPRLGEEVTPD